MTMHMLPAYFTTTNTKRKKKKAKSASAIKADQEHQKFLRKMGVHPDQRRASAIAKNRTLKVISAGGNPQMSVSTSCQRFTSDKIPVGVAVKPEPNIYSGKRKLLGIAAMHKSSLVPVFSEENAKEIARMRRG